MKKASFIFSAFIAAIAVFSLSFTNPGNGAASLNVDTKSSAATWKGYKVTGEHAGTVNIKNGSLQFTDGKLTGGSFEIDMNSIACTDLQGEWKEKLEGHLKSDDFFGVKTYPVAKFVMTKVISRGTAGSYKVIGNLTINGVTKEIKFDTNLTEAGNKVTATSNIRIDRSEFNVRYGSGSFFDSLGDKTIYDEFDISVKIVATK